MNDRKNILFIIVQMGMGGSERLVYNLITHLDNEKFAPHLAYFIGDEVHPEFRKLQIPIFKIFKNRRIDLSAMLQLYKIVKENKIDIVNAQHFMPMIYSYYGCKIRKRAGLICTFHSEWEIEQIPSRWHVIGAYIIKNIDGVVTVNSKIADLVRKKFRVSYKKIFTIKNGVDLIMFGTERNCAFGLKNSIKIEQDEIVIGAVGNLKKVKNHMFLLRAFELLLREEDKLKLVIAGQGFKGEPDNTESEIKEFIQEKSLGNKVILLGFRNDVANVLQIFDIFCLTSEIEGLPISLIEAMAAGLPVIGTNVRGIRDVIHDNNDGILVEPNDTIGLKNVLYTLIRHKEKRENIGKAARQKAIRMYSIENCVREYEKIFMSAGNLFTSKR